MTETNALLLDCDHVYAAHPRPRWAGKTLVFVRGKAFDGLGNGSKLQLKIDQEELAVAVVEIPVMRLPEGFHAVAILDIAAAKLFTNGIHEIQAELRLAG